MDMMDEAAQAGDAEQPAEESKKIRVNRKGRLIRYLAFFIGSFGAVFVTVWIALNRTGPEEPEVTEVLESAGADTTAVVAEASSDSTAQPATETGMPESSASQDLLRSADLVDTMNDYHERLSLKNQQIQQFTNLIRENEKLNEELDRMKKTMEQRDQDLAYYTQSLPASVAREVIEYQSRLLEAERTAEAQPQRQGTGPAAGQTQAAAGDEGVGFRKLAKIYEAMKPREAAPILAKLDDDEVLEILMRMRQRNAASILSSMDSETAARLSKLMGER